MIFEFTASFTFDFITDFSRKYDIPLRDNYLSIPASMGEGYVRIVAFGNDFRLLIHRYKLKEDFIIKRNPAIQTCELLSIFFITIAQSSDLEYNAEQPIILFRKS